MNFAITFAGIRGRWMRLGAEARDFALTHLAGGAAGLAAALLWAVMGEPRTLLDWIVLLWLASPLVLAGLACLDLPMRVLQAASAFNAILLLTGLAALSGGMGSVFLPWLVLVPAEAALTRRPFTLGLAMAGGAGAVLILWSASGALPAFALAQEWAAALMAASLMGCLLYAGGLALNVRAVYARAARKAAESEASYRFLADNAADLILRLSTTGAVIYASPACFALLRRQPIDLIGHPVGELVHAEDLPQVQRALMRAGYFGEEATIECRASGIAAEPIWIELRCRPVQRPEAPRRSGLFSFIRPKPKRHQQGMDIIAIARDITERRRHDEALKRAFDLAEAQSRAKSRFLANMSHELRTPLNSVLGFSEMISREMFGPLGDPRYREYATLIGESGQFLLNLINDILDVAKIEAGKYVLTREPLNLAVALERTLSLMMPQFREKGVQLKVDVATDLPMIEADARAVRQMIFNLLSNALKFTPEKGRTDIRLAREESALVLEVSDTGIGISEEDLKRLARPFEQANHSYARSQIGTGLGLALVKSLAGLHGGSLGITSKLGAGTKVRVQLPLGKAGAGASEIARAA